MIQGRISRSEVVQSNSDTQRTDSVQNLFHLFHIVDGQTLCYLQRQISGINTCLMNNIFYGIRQIGLGQLDHRQIYIHLVIRMSCIIPVFTIFTGSSKHMFSNRNDKSQILCQRNKFQGRNKSQIWTVPTDQRLRSYTGRTFLLNIHDGLIIYQELMVMILGTITHAFFHIQPLAGDRINFIGINGHPVFTTLLRFIHGNIRFFDQILYILSFRRIVYSTHTHGTVIIRVL